MVNILLTLTVGVIAFAVNILISSKDPFTPAAREWMISSFVVLFLAAITGLVILFTRLEDYRRTIQAARLMQHHPEEVTNQEVLLQASRIKRIADCLNRTTNILLYVQPTLFLTGFGCMTVSVFIVHGHKLM